MSNFYETVQSSADYILSHCPLRPTCGVVLGSGLGGLVDSMEDKTVLPYADIPHFPRSTVAGHAGNLVIGRLAGQPPFRAASTTTRASPCARSPTPCMC